MTVTARVCVCPTAVRAPANPTPPTLSMTHGTLQWQGGGRQCFNPTVSSERNCQYGTFIWLPSTAVVQGLGQRRHLNQYMHNTTNIHTQTQQSTPTPTPTSSVHSIRHADQR